MGDGGRGGRAVDLRDLGDRGGLAGRGGGGVLAMGAGRGSKVLEPLPRSLVEEPIMGVGGGEGLGAALEVHNAGDHLSVLCEGYMLAMEDALRAGAPAECFLEDLLGLDTLVMKALLERMPC